MKRKLALYAVTAAAAVGWFHFAATLSMGDAVWSLFFSRVSVPALLLAAGRAIEAAR